MGIVEEQTRASFQPIIHESIMAETMVVMRLRSAPSVAPLIPARSLAPLYSNVVSAPAELTSRSKNEMSWRRTDRNPRSRVRWILIRIRFLPRKRDKITYSRSEQ